MRALNRQQRRATILKFVLLYAITTILILIPFVFLKKFPPQLNEVKLEELKECRAMETTMSALTSSPGRLDATLKELHGNYVEIYDSLSSNVRGMVHDLGTSPGDWTEQLIEDFIYKVDKLERLQLRLKKENDELSDLLPQ
jgi:hypothetical protein